MMCVAPQTDLLAFDSELPNRDELLNTELMKIRLSELLGFTVENCELQRAKYQANHSLRVLYRVANNNFENFVSARIYAASRARTDFFIFPNDRKIRSLSAIEQKFNGRVVAYAPEKCVTIQCLDESQNVFSYAKIYAEKEFATGEKAFRFLTEQSAKSLFPKVWGFDELNKVLTLKNVEGNRLDELDRSQNKQAFRMLGKAIGELHEVKTKVDLPEFLRLSPERIKKSLKTISVARPDCRLQTEKLAEKLLNYYSFADEEKVVLHGDVHPKNGILRNDETLTLIDFDQLSYGNAAAEIGSFLAGLFYKKIIGFDSEKDCHVFSESFLQGYAEIRDLPSQESLNWHTAAALLTERASRSISRIRIEGLHNFSQILETSEQILVGGMK